MRKSIFLAVVVVVALVIAGTSGVFATWSDSEVSEGNMIETGSVDLKVNGADDQRVLDDGTVLWGDGVPAKVTVECMIPDKFYGPYEVELWNAGQCIFPSHAFIHLKNFVCSNAEPKINPYDPADPDSGGSLCWYNNYGPDASTGYPDPSTNQPYSGDLKPEPELVAEYGGKVDCTMVPGVGVDGDDCSMGAGLTMRITNSPNLDDILVNPDGVVMIDVFEKWECQEIWLFDLEPCQPRTIYFWFYLDQQSEREFGYNFFPHPNEFDPPLTPGTPEYEAALLHWEKFDDWPSWRYMKDMITFDIEFDLWLEDSPGGIVNPPDDD
jgi:predicted ribosomally synthesized peptide with SipW-like signal peptide